MPHAYKFTLEALFSLSETYYKAQGFVNWSDVSRDLGVSRQAVVDRLNKALETGDLPEADYVRWSGKPARRERSAEREAARRDAERRRVQAVLTPENHAWLNAMKSKLGKNSAQILNKLLDDVRNAR